MNRFFLMLSVLVSAIFIGCENESSAPKITSADLDFSATYAAMEGVVYPSLLLSKSAYEARTNDNLPDLFFSFKTPKKGCDLKVELAASALNQPTTFQQYLSSEKGTAESLFPAVNWDYAALRELEQQGTANLALKCYIDNEEVDNKNLRVSYRSVHECPWLIIRENDFVNLSWMFAGYVNEDHPAIDGFLQDVLAEGVITKFDGYASGDVGVYAQVFAIWRHLQAKGVKYSNIIETSNPDDAIRSQYIRGFEDVLNNTQANCADGSIFFASVLKRIGIEPFLVIVPNHMFMGFYTKSDKSESLILETTIIGFASLNDITETNYLDYSADIPEAATAYENGAITLDEYRTEASRYTFLFALDDKVSFWNENLVNFSNPENPLFQVLDIDELREYVQPIGL